MISVILSWNPARGTVHTLLFSACSPTAKERESQVLAADLQENWGLHHVNVKFTGCGRHSVFMCFVSSHIMHVSLSDSTPRRRGFDPRSVYVASVLGHVFSEHFSFPWQFSFQQRLHTYLSSGAGTMDTIVADVTSGLSSPHRNK
jgi:hypothetical protein